MPYATLVKRCSSAAYLSDVDITSIIRPIGSSSL